MASHQPESEWLTRKTRIDPKLDEAGWVLPKSGTKPLHAAHRTEEEETTNGPADYALWLDNKVMPLRRDVNDESCIPCSVDSYHRLGGLRK